MRARAAWIVRASAAVVRADSLPPLRIAALPVCVSTFLFCVYIYMGKRESSCWLAQKGGKEGEEWVVMGCAG